MTANVFFNALQAIDANGDAVSGAKVYFYDTGTSNLQTVYTDAGLGTPHPSPLVADSSGVFAPVFQSGSTDIKVNMTDASDVDLPGYPIDPVTLQSTASGASLIPFSPTPRIVATDVQAAIEEVDGEVKVIEDARTIENSVYTTAGTTTTYTIAVTDFTDYATGNRFWVRVDATNTGASTINVESVGAKDIKKYDSAGSIQALAADDFAVGSEYLLHYDGTQFVIIAERLNKASFTDATTGTQNTKYMTALRTKQAIDAFNPFGNSLLHVRDEKTTGTEGGGSSTATDNIRTLNTVVTNEVTGASLSSNVITLPAGDYYIAASVPVRRSDRHRAFLYNTSDSSVEVIGVNAYASGTNDVNNHSFVCGRFSIVGTKNFELRHYTELGRATDGLGLGVDDGRTEVYSDVQIWKVA